MIEVSGGIDGHEDLESDDLEPMGEFRLPILTFRGLTAEVMVDASPIPEPRSILGFLRGMKAAIVGRPGAGLSSVPLAKFLEEHPHPPVKNTIWCESADRDRDYALGAGVCRFCRDRLAVIETLVAHPAVRLVPPAR